MQELGILKKIITFSMIFLRIAAVFTLWLDPFLGFWFNHVLDWIDGDILARLGIKREWYQKYDKRLDFLFYIGMFVYAISTFEKDAILILFLLSFIYRFVGMIIYEITNHEWLLFVFTNYSSLFFLLKTILPGVIVIDFKMIIIIFIIIISSLIKEWILHVAKYDTTSIIPGIGKKW